MFKIKREGLATLCARCKHSAVVQGEGRQLVLCHELGRHMSFNVSDCSSFSDRSVPDLWNLQQMAWVLASDIKRPGKVGFMTPKDYRDRLRAGKEEPLTEPPGLKGT